MKKILTAILCIAITIGVCGCSKKSSPVSLDNLYSINSEICQGSFKAKATMTRLGNGGWDITFTEPATIKDMNLTYENGNVKISYKGLETEIKQDDTKFSGCCKSITSLLDQFSTSGKNMRFTEDGNEITAKGEKSGEDFELKFNKKTKTLKSLQYEADNLKVNFSDYKKSK